MFTNKKQVGYSYYLRVVMYFYKHLCRLNLNVRFHRMAGFRTHSQLMAGARRFRQLYFYSLWGYLHSFLALKGLISKADKVGNH